MPRSSSIRRAVAFAVLASVVAWSWRGNATGDGSVPPAVQAQLLVKVTSYDRGFRERAGSTAQIVLLSKSSSAESRRVTNQLEAALRREATIAGLPFEVSVVDFKNTTELVKECKARSAAILYVPTDFDAEIDSICAAVEPLRLRTITGVPDYVKRCVVLGFRLDAGRPKLLVNLVRAERNDVHYKSELLKLAEVYR